MNNTHDCVRYYASNTKFCLYALPYLIPVIFLFVRRALCDSSCMWFCSVIYFVFQSCHKFYANIFFIGPPLLRQMHSALSDLWALTLYEGANSKILGLIRGRKIIMYY